MQRLWTLGARSSQVPNMGGGGGVEKLTLVLACAFTVPIYLYIYIALRYNTPKPYSNFKGPYVVSVSRRVLEGAESLGTRIAV